MSKKLVTGAPLGSREASEYLGISESYLYKLTSRREIPHFKSRGGKLLFFRTEDLDAWAFGRRVACADEIDQRAVEWLVSQG